MHDSFNRRLDEIVEEILAAYRSGRVLDINELCSCYPEVANDIRELYPTLIRLEQARPLETNISFEHLSQAPAAFLQPGAPPLGDYRIVREIGRGGMGVIYEARQETLNRRVALKVLPSWAMDDPRRVQRFEREARAAAGLHHTNIVPVLGVGTDNGLHYIVMQLIDGCALDEIVRELRRLRDRRSCSERDPFNDGEGCKALQIAWRVAVNDSQADSAPWQRERETGALEGGWRPDERFWRSVAQIGVQAAEALQYAASQGIIHRDIKPSNLLLDRNMTVWISDFGLAKATSSDDLTRTGELVGTLRYLSPERLRGESGIHGDIYGLGATLYELVTLQPPFRDSEQAVLVQQIANTEPLRPRKVDPSIPRDLETIIVKSMAKDARYRYATAGELATDLQCFLEDRPIAARRASTVERFSRWCRRNPSVAILTTTLFAVLVAVAVGASLTAIWLDEKNKVAYAAEQRATDAEASRRRELFRVQLARAQETAARVGPGHRLDGLQAVRDAVVALPSNDLTPDRMSELVNAAVPCLTHSDVRELFRFEGARNAPDHPSIDAQVERVAFSSPDGASTIVQRISDSTTHQELRLPENGTGQARSATMPRSRIFSPSGRWLCEFIMPTSSEEVARTLVWDLPSGKLALDWLPSANLIAIDFHPDGRHLLVAGQDGVLRLFDLSVGKQVRESPPRFGGTPVVRYSSDGSMLAVAQISARVQIVDPQSWGTIAVLPDMGPPRAIVWNPRDSTMIVGTTEGRLYQWDHVGRSGRYLAGGHTGRIVHLECTSDGRMLWSVGDEATQVLRLQGDQVLLTLPGGAALSSDGRRVVTADGKDLIVRELIAAPSYRRIVRSAEAAEFNRDGKWLVVSGVAGVQLYSVSDLDMPGDLHLDGCGPVAFAPDGKEFITFGMFSHAWRWPLVGGDQPRIGPPRPVVPGAFLPKDAAELHPQHEGCHAAYSGDGHYVALADFRHGTVLVTDSKGDTREFAKLQGATRVSVSPDGRWIAGSAFIGASSQWSVKVWNAVDGRTVLDLPGHSGAVFSPDGRWLAAPTNNEVRIYDVSTFTCARRIECPENRARLASQVAFQPGGRLLAVADPVRSIRLFDRESGRLLATLTHPEPGYTIWLSFSPDGSHLAATRRDLDISIWNLASLQAELIELGLNPGRLTSELPKSIGQTGPARIDRGDLPAPGTWFEYWKTLALHEAVDKIWFDAIHNASIALEQVPPDEVLARAELLTLRGEWYVRNQDPARAILDLREAFELNPDALRAARMLARLYALGPSNVRDARRVAPLIALLTANDVSDPAARVLLGVAHVRLGRYAQGRQTLEQVATAEGWQSVVAYALALAHNGLGDREVAAKALARARTLDEQTRSDLTDDEAAELERLRTEAEAALAAPALPRLRQ